MPLVLEHLDHKPNEKLRSVGKLIIRARGHEQYFSRREQIFFERFDNFEGAPLEDFHRVVCRSAETGSEKWSLTLTYHDTRYGDYDYVSDIHRDYSTAYKIGPKGHSERVMLLIHRGVFKSAEDESDLAFDATISQIEGTVSVLDAAVSELTAWAASGLAMAVICRTFSCQAGPTIIGSGKIAWWSQHGLSLAELRRKFACKTCGQRNPILSPV